jgi:integrase
MALLNLDNIPGRMISGMNCNELDFVSSESNIRNVFELSGGFLNMLNDRESSEIVTDEILQELDALNEECGIRTQDIPGAVQDHLNEIEDEGMPYSSKKQMNTIIKRFEDFLRMKKLNANLLAIPKSFLNNYLRYFYSELRQVNGSYYAPKSLVCFRAGLHRYFCLKRPEINILTDPEFAQSNRMLRTMVAKYKTSGQKKPSEFDAIQKNDMIILRQYFDRSSPKILQQEVLFNLMFFFGLRGRETIPQLTKSSVVCLTSSTNKKYLKIDCETLSKNTKASLLQKEFEDKKNARAYENSENPSECPVKAWLQYTELIAECDSLFPKPISDKSRKYSVWYCQKLKLGKHSIDNLMKNLSIDLRLSRIYTNHCIRVSLVTILKEQGHSNAEISQITGHKNEMSVERYKRKRQDEDYEDLSRSLQTGSSSTVVQLNRASKGRIVVSRPIPQTDDITDQQPTAINVSFNGTFYNCNFECK